MKYNFWIQITWNKSRILHSDKVAGGHERGTKQKTHLFAVGQQLFREQRHSTERKEHVFRSEMHSLIDLKEIFQPTYGDKARVG